MAAVGVGRKVWISNDVHRTSGSEERATTSDLRINTNYNHHLRNHTGFTVHTDRSPFAKQSYKRNDSSSKDTCSSISPMHDDGPRAAASTPQHLTGASLFSARNDWRGCGP